MLFSAASLVKRSASQLIYLQKNNNAQIEPTARMKLAMKYQNNASAETSSKEMGGAVHVSTGVNNQVNVICFSVDEVQLHRPTSVIERISTGSQVARLIEHKFLDNLGPIPDWFLQQSLIQVALYGALALKVNELKTAKFHVDQGNTYYDYALKHNKLENLLVFTMSNQTIGEEIDPTATMKTKAYIVEPSQEVLDFYTVKAECVASNNYSKAKEFDLKYKWKEWELLSKYINYRTI